MARKTEREAPINPVRFRARAYEFGAVYTPDGARLLIDRGEVIATTRAQAEYLRVTHGFDEITSDSPSSAPGEATSDSPSPAPGEATSDSPSPVSGEGRGEGQ